MCLISHRRRGMTLVELLVVIMILGLLAAATIPLLSSTAGRRGREAAATLATMATRANGYARQLTDSNASAGLYLMPLTPRDPDASAQPEDVNWDLRPAPASADLAVAESKQPYAGDASDSGTFCIHQYTANARRHAIFAFERASSQSLAARIINSFPTMTVAGQSSAIAIMSSPSSAILAGATPPIVNSGAYWFVNATALKADDTFDTLVGTGKKSFAISLPPTQALPAALKMPGEYVVDTGWCTCGTTIFRPLTTPMPQGVGTFVGLPYFDCYGPLTLLFGLSGDLQKYTYNEWDPSARYSRSNYRVASENAYLLVGKVDRVSLPYRPTPTNREPGANWQYPDSRWIRFSGRDGAVLIADPVPNATSVFNSQGYARRGISSTRL